MEVNNILLVIERSEQKEKNTIILMNDKNRKILSNYNIELSDLNTAYGNFNDVRPDVLMKRCCDLKELVEFFHGKFNIAHDCDTYYDAKNIELCNILRQLLMPHYEKIDISPQRGDKIQNTNGKMYSVVDILDDYGYAVDALLIDESMDIVVARGLKNFNISYEGDSYNKLRRNAYEWDAGRYYGKLNSNTNMRSIRLENVEESPPHDIYEYRNNLLCEYLQTQDIIADSRYDGAIRTAASEVLRNKFADMEYHEFDEALMKGYFDTGFKKDMIKKKEAR